jgi:hypothetical protein
MTDRIGTLALAAALVGAGVAVAACTAGDDFLPAYGVANGLAGKSPALATTATGDDGGGTTGGSCTIDAGTCAVSFSKDIEPMFSTQSVWGCTNMNCHGGTLQTPQITGTPALDYPTLTAYSTNFTRPYINSCSTDPAQSSISCNITTTGDSCDGMSAMPVLQYGNSAPTTTQLAMITTWLQCGAPNN